MAGQMKNKRIPVIAGIVLGAAIIILLVVFLPQVFDLMQADTGEPEIVRSGTAEEHEGKGLSQELEQILNNDKFMDTFSCFYYPRSEIKSFQSTGEKADFLYILLEVDQSFSAVEAFYRSKKVQSVWSKSEFYERSYFDEELFFTEGQDNMPVSRHTFHSTGKDKIVNVLINGIDNHSTRIMVIYWEP